jgi:hypothetical protein
MKLLPLLALLTGCAARVCKLFRSKTLQEKEEDKLAERVGALSDEEWDGIVSDIKRRLNKKGNSRG